MSLINVFALLAAADIALAIYICQRHNRRQAIRAERMMRSLELAIRRQACE